MLRLEAERDSLRSLVSHKHHSTETWQMVHRLLTLIEELSDLDTPLKSTSWDGAGHSSDEPILPGTYLSDKDKDRRLYHSGSYAADLSKWLHRQIRWVIASTENRLKGKEPDPRPRPPRATPFTATAEGGIIYSPPTERMTGT